MDTCMMEDVRHLQFNVSLKSQINKTGSNYKYIIYTWIFKEILHAFDCYLWHMIVRVM